MLMKSRKNTKRRVAKHDSSIQGSDLSNRTVVIMLVIVILVSVASLGVFLSSLNAPTAVESEGYPQGTVGLMIMGAPSPSNPGSSAVGGEVGLMINNPTTKNKR